VFDVNEQIQASIDAEPRTLYKRTERELIELYKLEVAAIRNKTGGNPAAASDMLRTVSWIRILGMYTDFDIQVDFTRFGGFLADAGYLPSNSFALFNVCSRSRAGDIIYNNDIYLTDPNAHDTHIFMAYLQKTIIDRCQPSNGITIHGLRMKLLDTMHSTTTTYQQKLDATIKYAKSVSMTTGPAALANTIERFSTSTWWSLCFNEGFDADATMSQFSLQGDATTRGAFKERKVDSIKGVLGELSYVPVPPELRTSTGNLSCRA